MSVQNNNRVPVSELLGISEQQNVEAESQGGNRVPVSSVIAQEENTWVSMRDTFAPSDADADKADSTTKMDPREGVSPRGNPTFENFEQVPKGQKKPKNPGMAGVNLPNVGSIADRPDTIDPIYQAKYVGESVIKGIAGIADFVDLIVGDGDAGELSDKLLWNHNNKNRVEQGKEPLPYKPQESFTKMSEKAIKSFYAAIGQEPELVEIESGVGRAGQFAIENLVGGGIVTGGMKTGGKYLSFQGKKFVDWFGGKVDDVVKIPMRPKTQTIIGDSVEATAARAKQTGFMADEVPIALTGAIGGGLGYEIGETEEQKETYANLMNFVGAFAPAAKNLAGWGPAGIAYRSVAKIARDAPDADTLWKMHDKHVMANLAKLVPEDQLGKLKAKVATIRAIQTVIPDFKPSVGATIGTSHSRQVQSYIDSQSGNFGAASRQYRMNKDAVERITKEITEETDPTKREIVAQALRILRKDSVLEADRLTMAVKTAQSEVADLARAGTSDTKRGLELREAYKAAKIAYRKHFNTIWDDVDPEGTAKFDVTDVEELITAHRATRSLNNVVSEEDKGFTFLNTALPNYLKGLKNSRAGFAYTVAGAKPPQPTMTFTEVRRLRTILGRKASQLRSTEPDNAVASILDNIRESLKDTVDSKMTTGDPSVAERYTIASDSYRDVFSANFQSGMSKRIMQTAAGKDVPADKIPGLIWNSGAKDADTALLQFNDTFSAEKLKIPDSEALQVARGVAIENLSDYAIRDLHLTLDGAKDAPAEAMTAWMKRNEANLEAFPAIREQVHAIGARVSEESLGIDKMLLKRDDLIDNVLNKYDDIDSDTLIPQLMKSSPNTIKRTLRDLLHRNGILQDFDPETVDIRSIRSVLNRLGRSEDPAEVKRASEGMAILDALSEATVQTLTRRSMGTGGQGFKPEYLSADLKGLDSPVSEEALKILLNPKGQSEISTLRKAAFLLGEENTNPAIKLQLDDIVAVFDQYNMSIPSISARIYAVQLGKVGPAFIIADNAQRIFRGISSKRTNDVYNRTMYNLEGLEEMIDLRIAAGQGDDEAMRELAKYTGELRNIFTDMKKFAKDPKEFLRQLIPRLEKMPVMHGVRLQGFFKDLEEYEEEDTGLTDFMLRTLHPQRLNTMSNEQAADLVTGDEEDPDMALSDITPFDDAALAIEPVTETVVFNEDEL